MPKKLTHHESFAPISRGLIAHMQYLSSNATKLFLYILLRVKTIGENKGIFTGYVHDCCQDLGWISKTWYKTIKEISPYVKYKPQESRHKPFQIIVQRYKAMDDFYVIPNGNGSGHSKGTVKGTVKGQYGDSKGTVTTPNLSEQNDLKSLKKDKDIDIEKNKRYRPLSLLLKDRILERRQQKVDEGCLCGWDREARLMVEQDSRSEVDIRQLINECHNMEPSKTGFTWRNNILSMTTLRKQWNDGKIFVGMLKDHVGHNPHDNMIEVVDENDNHLGWEAKK